MTTQAQFDFLRKALNCAELAGHIWPEYAACEAALESSWGASRLCKEANNLFGEHQHKQPVWETYNLHPNDNVDFNTAWVKFPNWIESFRSRMQTLERLAPKDGFEHYANALKAQDGEVFVREVSAKWAQDQARAEHVLQIHRAHFKDGVIV